MKENVKLAEICLARSEKHNIGNLLLYKSAKLSSDELEKNLLFVICLKARMFKYVWHFGNKDGHIEVTLPIKTRLCPAEFSSS